MQRPGAVLLLLLVVSPAQGASGCMTRLQAAAAFPGKWLYWHTKNRCWDATPVRLYNRQVRRAVSVSPQPAPEPLPVQKIKGVSTFIPWDDRIPFPGPPYGSTIYRPLHEKDRSP
jgi:hypothetical protein